MKIEIIRKPDKLDEFSQTWGSLDSLQATPIEHYIWHKACAETFAPDQRLFIVITYNDGVPTAIAPLLRPASLLNPYVQLGVRELGEPSDFIYSNAAAAESVTRYLADKKIPLRLSRIPSHSPIVSAVRNSYRGRALISLKPAANYPYITLTPEWVEPESQLSGRLPSDLRRARRKTERFGKPSFEILAPSDRSELDSMFEEFMQIEAAGWKGDTGTALQHDLNRQEFFKRYCMKACEQGILRICFMRIDGLAVAGQLAIEAAGGFWLLKIGYNEEFSKCSPGMLLMLETIRYAACSGLRTYEFLGVTAPWTRRWTTTERTTVQISVFPYTLVGAILMIKSSFRKARGILRIKKSK